MSEEEGNNLFNKVTWLQGYLDCLFNIETAFDGSLALFLSPTGLQDFVENALNSTGESYGEKYISSFVIDGNIVERVYSYEFIDDFFNRELIIKPFDMLSFNYDIKKYTLYKFLDILTDIFSEYLDESRLVEYCHGLHKNQYIFEGTTSSQNFDSQIISFPFKNDQFLIMSLAKNLEKME
ncbi:hypothetical protein QSV37_18525 [Acinetobacter sp. VNK23]|uniref:hypothetical protein n=1 Tax=Acinetobacter thutiue TaxID=2998078 RepID=UPI002575E3CC|nr:hypothetical protein [Acinetobacter thutiue]MDM1022260.1 hypothetical protein [Acinetobacter thutiue]